MLVGRWDQKRRCFVVITDSYFRSKRFLVIPAERLDKGINEGRASSSSRFVGYQGTAIGTATVAFVVIVVVFVGAVALVSFTSLPAPGGQPTASSESTITQPLTTANDTSGAASTNQTVTGPCGLRPGVSVVTADGVQTCVTGPPLVVNPDGEVDFRNGTVIVLHANLTGVATFGDGGSGGRNDTVGLHNGTRIIFNSRGVLVTISPYQGRAAYSNGTVVDFPACQHPINPDLRLPSGASGNGTAWWTSSDGTVVRFYANGTCS